MVVFLDMRISDIIKKLLGEWSIDIDFTEEEMDIIMKESAKEISAYSRKKILKEEILLFTIWLN